MKVRLISSLSLVALLFSPISFADEALLQEARSLAKQLPPKLKTVLEQEIADKGHVGAIDVCRDKAPEIAKQVVADSGWKIKRVTLKARNSHRATPDEWEKATLAEFEQRAAAGEAIETMDKSATVNNEYRYAKALGVQPLCLSCHGGAEVTDEIRQAIKQQYPEDAATGYSAGQIRGAISLRRGL